MSSTLFWGFFMLYFVKKEKNVIFLVMYMTKFNVLKIKIKKKKKKTEMEPEGVNELLHSYNKTLKAKELFPMDEQREWFLK